MSKDPEECPLNGVLQGIVEELIVQHRSCEIVYRAQEGGRVIVRDRIMRLYEENGRARIRTAGGLEIDLDHLIGIDGKTPDPSIHSC
ncbi:MAG TPA: hypothetical protein VNU72_11600 [Puia sp.]|jgi:hypothetical protein|nr:hypothetical protein [Puia sp.]